MLWLLATTTICGALVKPTLTLPKGTVPGDIVSGVVPMPATPAVCGLP
jgi:hypothetical protein